MNDDIKHIICKITSTILISKTQVHRPFAEIHEPLNKFIPIFFLLNQIHSYLSVEVLSFQKVICVSDFFLKGLD